RPPPSDVKKAARTVPSSATSRASLAWTASLVCMAAFSHASARARTTRRGVLSCPAGGGVGAPAAVGGDLALAFAEGGLAEDAERVGAVIQADFADAEPGRFLQENRRQALGGDRPDFERDRGAALGHPDHRGVPVVDGPQAIDGRRPRFADERGPGVDE